MYRPYGMSGQDKIAAHSIHGLLPRVFRSHDDNGFSGIQQAADYLIKHTVLKSFTNYFIPLIYKMQDIHEDAEKIFHAVTFLTGDIEIVHAGG